jgi:hypothetical protein
MTRDAPLPENGQPASGITAGGIMPSGLIHCLHLLAEDAARLGLPRTHLAICQVLEICEAERIEQGGDPTQGYARRVQ